MNHENNKSFEQEPLSRKGKVHEIDDKIEAFRMTPTGKVLGWVVSILLAIAGLSYYWDPIIAFLSTVSLFPLSIAEKVILGTVAMGCLAFMIFRTPKNDKLKVVGFAVIVLLILPFVMSTTTSDPHELIVVYEESHPQIYPAGTGAIPAYPLSEIYKLAQIKEIDASATFISTVDRPSARWGRHFERGFNPEDSIISIQEVLKSDDPRFIDISFSSFERELTSAAIEGVLESAGIVVFFEKEYLSAEDRLRKSLRRESAEIQLTSLIFDGAEQQLEIKPGSIVIFLGSPELFSTFNHLVQSHAYSKFLVPNWIRPHIGNVASVDEARNFVVLSSTLEMLMIGSDRHWNEVVALIKDAIDKERDVRSFVSDALIDKRTTVKVGF